LEQDILEKSGCKWRKTALIKFLQSNSFSWITCYHLCTNSMCIVLLLHTCRTWYVEWIFLCIQTTYFITWILYQTLYQHENSFYMDYYLDFYLFAPGRCHQCLHHRENSTEVCVNHFPFWKCILMHASLKYLQHGVLSNVIGVPFWSTSKIFRQ